MDSELPHPGDKHLFATAPAILALSYGGHALVRREPAELLDLALYVSELCYSGGTIFALRAPLAIFSGRSQLRLAFDQHMEAADGRSSRLRVT